MLGKEITIAVTRAAKDAGIDPAALLAVVEVESAGRAFARVDGRDEPLIRFEGHYFDRRLSGAKREAARAAGLASPAPGKIANPRAQAGRWMLYDRAAAIDAGAAAESVSWGIGQVMGAHWAWLGYANVGGLVAEARSGLDGQLRLMLRYIEKAGLLAALRKRDWEGFARGYNGPSFRNGNYHIKLARAFARYRTSVHDRPLEEPVPGPDIPERVIGRGARGGSVRELQRLLVRHGHELAVDGFFGPRTEDRLRAFQGAAGLAADGIAGPATWRALLDGKARREPVAAWLGRFVALLRSFLGI